MIVNILPSLSLNHTNKYEISDHIHHFIDLAYH